MKTKALGVALLLGSCLGVLLPACGGDGEVATQDEGTPEERYMRGYCEAVERHLVPVWEVRHEVETRPAKDIDIEKAFDEFHQGLVAFGEELEGLEPPDDVQSLHDTSVSALRDLDDALIEIRAGLDFDVPLDRVRAAANILEPAVLIVGKFPPPLLEIADAIPKCRDVRLDAADLGVSLTEMESVD